MSAERVNAGVGVARLILDIMLAIFDRAKASKDAERDKRIADLESEVARLKENP